MLPPPPAGNDWLFEYLDCCIQLVCISETINDFAATVGKGWADGVRGISWELPPSGIVQPAATGVAVLPRGPVQPLSWTNQIYQVVSFEVVDEVGDITSFDH